MKRALKYTLVATPVLFGLFALTAWLTPMGDLSAAEGCGPCGSVQTTPVVTGTSGDCPWAEMDAKAKALAEVECDSDEVLCGAANVQIVTPCTSGPPYVATAQATYRCRHCDPIFP